MRSGNRNRETGNGREPASRFPLPASRVVVIQTAFLGDVVLTLPLIIRLAERYGPVDVVTTPAAAPIVERHPAVRHVIRHDKHRAQRFAVSNAALTSAPYARAYLPHRSFRSALLALGIPSRIGFGGRFPALAYTERHPWPDSGHVSERILSLLPGTALPPRPWIELTADDRLAASSWMSRRGVSDGFIALAPGSRWGTKRWPYYAELAKALAGPVVVLGDGADRLLGDVIVAAAGPRAVNACGDLTLRQSAALITRSARLFTNDSAPLHLATALDHPVTAIFGPTIPAFGFGPFGANGTIVEHPNMPCRPCSSHGPMVCPLGHHRCMVEIDAQTVAGMVNKS
jgi:heptosyltransferase II